MPRRAHAYRLLLSQVAPVHDPAFLSAAPAVRAEVLGWVLLFGLEEKDADLSRGLDARGNPLVKVSQYTREHRHSAMGPADPNAPALTPAYGLSRTRSLLDGAVMPRAQAVEFYWRFDENTGASWGKVLAYHARGGRLPVRDVIGIGPAAVARVRARVLAQWADYKRGVARTPARALPAPPNPAPPFTVRTVRAHVPRFPGLATPDRNRRVSQLDVNGKTYTIGAGVSTSGGRESVSAASLRRSIAAGTFSGFHRHQIPGRTPPAAPPAPRPDPRPGPAPRRPAAARIAAVGGQGSGDRGRVSERDSRVSFRQPTPNPRPPAPTPAAPRAFTPPAVRPASAVAVLADAGTMRRNVEHALAAVDRVHGVGPDAPPVPFRTEAGAGRNGAYYYDPATGRPNQIRVGELGSHPLVTAAHEFGHYLDGAVVPGHGKGDRDFATDPTVRAWRAAVEGTRAYQSLAAHRGTGAFADYLLRGDELWARAYAQYVAVRSGDPRMLGELDTIRETDSKYQARPRQWADDDFGPVAREFDRLFTKLGWRP